MECLDGVLYKAIEIFVGKAFYSVGVLLSLLLPLFAALFYLPFAFLSFLSLLSYLLVLFCISMSINLRSKISISYLLLSFVVLHLSYGYGSLVGIYKCIGYGK